MRRAAHVLLVPLLLTGCATARVAPMSPDPGATGSMTSARAICEEMAGREERSAVFRASLALGAVGTGLMTVYAAAYGALWGSAIAGGRADGAWIGAAAGAGIGMVLGIVDGIARAQEARARYRAAYEVCLSELEQTPRLDGESPSTE
jgi:hypothetical protein